MGAGDKKLENRYRFKTFSERIAEISADVAHNISLPRNETPEDADTFFYEELQKWADLNLTQHYADFQSELGPDIQSFAQLLHRKDEIIALLQTHLAVEDSLALQPLLALVAALARDLRADLGPSFPDLFSLLCRLLNTKDPDRIQWVFTCLAHLYKLLWRHLTANIEATYRMYRQLLSGSQPPHVVRFAAESFAFVCRKVKDKTKFFAFVHKKLAEDPSQVNGVGRLIFETMRGVRGRLHADAAAVLCVQLQLLHDSHVTAPLSQQALQVALLAAARHVTREHAAPLWDELWCAVSSCSDERPDILSHILHLLLSLLQHRGGALLTDPSAAAVHCADLWRRTLEGAEVMKVTADLTAALLTAHSAKLQLTDVTRLVMEVVKSPQSPTTVLHLLGQLFSLAQFESHILPELLAYVHLLSEEAAPEAVALLARLVLVKRPPPDTPDSWNEWTCYPLDFNFAIHKQMARRSSRLVKTTTPDPLLHLVTSQLLSPPSASDEEKLRHALLVAPHLRPLQHAEIGAALWNRWQHLAHQITENVRQELEEDPADPISSISISPSPLPSPLNNQLSLLSQLTETALRLSPAGGTACWPAALNLSRSRRLAGSGHLLRMIGLLMETVEVEKSDQLMVIMYRRLGQNLAAPQHKLRLLTLYLLSRFSPSLPAPPPPPAAAPPSVFVTCYEAEQCLAEVYGYQERLRHLQGLQAEYIAHALPTIADFSMAPLLYLIGQLHVPFRLLWKPSQEMLVSLCQSMPAEAVTALWRRLVAGAAAAVQHTAKLGEECSGGGAEGLADQKPDKVEGSQSSLTSAALASATARLAALDDRVDHTNFRLLLWGVTADLCLVLEEGCGADLISHVFSFLENEFFSSDMSFARHQDLLDRKTKNEDNTRHSKRKSVSAQERAEDETLVEDMEDEEEEEDEEPTRKRTGEKKKGIVQALVAHLTVLSKMTSLRRSPRSSQLCDTFFHFLTHKRTDVQRAALECVYAYKTKALNGYREVLFSLLEDTNFKTRLTDLSIDTENGLVKLEHRPYVLPVITRILYGRMRTSTGKGAASRDNSAARRRLIAGFLAGCAPQEVDAFLDLTLGTLAQHVQDDPVSMVHTLITTVDVRRALPPRQLQSSLLLLSALLQRLGRRLQQNVSRLLRLLLCAAATAAGLLMQQDVLPVWHTRTLKKVRGMVLGCLCQLYDRFDTHPFTAAETDAVFEACVWPVLPRLSQEATTAPTALVKLFMMWAANPRYLPLLAKRSSSDDHPSSAGLCPLSALFSLLEVPSCHTSVTAMVVRAAEILLTTRETEDEEAEVAPLVVNGTPEAEVSGASAVGAHVSPLLHYLRRRLETAGAGRLSTSELSVLSAVCRLEGGPGRQHAASLAALLLPVLSASRPPSEQRQKQLLTTLKHLLSAVERPTQFVRPLSALFSLLPSRDLHLAVTSCLCALAAREPALSLHADTVQALNAMAPEHVDEPDFERRLVVYGQINERLRQASSLEEEYLRLVVHNCFWVLEHESEMALRDSSTFCLQEVSGAVGRLFPVHQSACMAFISSCFLPALRLRLRSKADELRHEAVAVLQATVVACGQHLPRMQQLSQLCDQDPEMDFFKNIRHVQIHRRTKALKRVVEGLSDGSLEMRADVVTNYILPLGNVYLFNDKYHKYQGLTEVAVRLVGVVAGRMSWHQYQAFLRHFLFILPSCARQKDAVRVLVTVLDAFQFDLSSVTPDVTMSIISAARTEKAGGKTQGKSEEERMDERVTKEGDAEKSGKDGDAKEGQKPGSEGDSSAGEKDATTAPTEAPEDSPEDATAAELPEDPDPSPDTSSTTNRQAEMICRTLIRSTLPGLHAGLVRRARGDDNVTRNSSAGVDEERAQRLPLALAMVKLLQKLPKGILDANVASVLVRVCELLRSRTPSVREVARDTLCRCVHSLGTNYLPLAVTELRATTGRGFQLHVMVHTLHAMLKSVMDLLQPGHVDQCVNDIVEVCHMELFEQQADEKEVAKITAKTAEAKGIKAYKMLHMTAKFITETSVMPLIRPLQEWVSTARTAKASLKVAECLRHACSGLSENAALTPQALLVLSHALVSESLPPVAGGDGPAQGKKKGEKVLPVWLKRQDMLLLPETPKRAGTPAKVTSTVNSHLLVDSGLQLLSSVLRRDKQLLQQLTHMLDPLLPLLTPILQHADVKVVTACVRCWTLLLPLALPSLPDHLPAVSGALFSTLHKYAVPGLAPGDNFDMVAVAFKAVTVLVKDVRSYTLTEDQLRVLLTYAEQDLQDPNRQGTAFQLVRAILSRKLHAPELVKVVTVLRQLAVTADGGQLRQQARATVIQYLLDYPLGRRVTRHVTFFLQQLGYGHESGRLAALEACSDICRQFPQSRLSSLSSLLLLYLSTRLVADPAPACRRQVAATITALLCRVNADTRGRLLDMALAWLHGENTEPGKKTEQARMAAQLVGLFLSENSGTVPDSHLDRVLPALCGRLNPDVNDFLTGAPQASEFSPERHSDQLLYQLLVSLLKLLTRWPETMAAGHRHTELISATWGHVKQYLLHPHTWVRLASGQLLGLLFSQAEPAAAATALMTSHVVNQAAPVASLPPYLANETARKLRGLALDLCVQLSSDLLSQNLADQCVKNLVWVAKALICAGAIDGAPHQSPETTPHGNGKRTRRDSELSNGRAGSESPQKSRKTTSSETSQNGRKRTAAVSSHKSLKRFGSESSQKSRKRSDSESSLKLRERTDSELSVGGRKRTESESSVGGRKRTESESNQTDSAEWGLSLRWLTRRLRREVNAEVVKNPKITIRRSSVFKWAAAVSLALGDRLSEALPLLLPPLVREIADPTAPLQLKTLATEVTDLMKRQLGVEAFTAAYSRAQAALNQRKAERRVQRAQELLTNPTKTTKLKMQKHLKKSAVKKRKLMQDKQVGFKRRKTAV